jgi:hypothetical protein
MWALEFTAGEQKALCCCQDFPLYWESPNLAGPFLIISIWSQITSFSSACEYIQQKRSRFKPPPSHRPRRRRAHTLTPRRRPLRQRRHRRRPTRPRIAAHRTITPNRQPAPYPARPRPRGIQGTFHRERRRPPSPDDAVDEFVEAEVHLHVDHVRAAGSGAPLRWRDVVPHVFRGWERREAGADVP